MLADLIAARRPGQVIVGFAAETGTPRWAGSSTAGASSPARAPTCSWSTVGSTGWRSSSDNSAVVLAADGGEIEIPPGPKASLAATVWDLVADRLA